MRGSLDLLPLHPDITTPTTVARSLAAAVEGRAPGTIVVEASLIGPRLPADGKVVEVMRRADAVVAERRDRSGIRRVVTWRGVDLLDAGAVEVPGALVAFPPDDGAAAAAELAEGLGGSHRVVLACRATPTGVPAVWGSAGTVETGVERGLALVDAPTVLVQAAPAAGEFPTRPGPVLDNGYDMVRAALGVTPGTADSVEAGLRPLDPDEDTAEVRIERACRVALRSFAEVPFWHPVRRHLTSQVDPSDVRATVLQTGVRLDAPDDLSLGAAVGRLVVALAGEDLSATPIRHEKTQDGVSALVAFLDDLTGGRRADHVSA